MKTSLKYLTQEVAQQVDIDLMGQLAFSVDQLMELAGLSVAQSIAKEFPSNNKPLIICGPGNNGGDGLVCARHLKHFKFQPYVLYPKQTKSDLYSRLVKQLEVLSIPVLTEIPQFQEFDFIVDAIFGFSFKPPIRAPFGEIIQKCKESGKPIVSVDIPSGWDVEQGDISGQGLKPTMLVSLTAPKLCAQNFKGIHYIGGRFVPQCILDKYNFTIPDYPGYEQIVKVNQEE